MVGSKLIYIDKDDGQIVDSRGIFDVNGKTFFDYGKEFADKSYSYKEFFCYGVYTKELEIPKECPIPKNNKVWKTGYQNKTARKERKTFSLNFPDDITRIEDLSFSYCKNMVGPLNIPTKVKKIGVQAFVDCSGLTSVYIPKSVAKIEDKVFAHCSGVTKITVDPENKFYDSREDCNAIIETKKNKLIFACNDAFIPDSVTEISSCAFSGCRNIKKLTISKNVTTIARTAFYKCVISDEISVDPENPVYDSRDNCNAIIETRGNRLLVGCGNTVVPDGVIYIGDSAFSDRTNLEKIVIPSSVKVIEDSGFSGCKNLTYVEISDFVHLSDFAFCECESLTKIVCRSIMPPACDEDVFDGCDSISEILVPEEVVGKYKVAIGWCKFRDKIKPIED